MQPKICFIIPFYGKVPEYLNLFLNSCKNNDNYTFIFFTDIEFKSQLPSNVNKIRLSFEEFKQLIEEKTGIKPNIPYFYKIVDFKPAYGLIFEDYLRDYDYWGMLDIDLILGNINNFITEELLIKYDVISARKYWLSASFALFRNCFEVNTLFMLSESWQEVFQNPKPCRFTEFGSGNVKIIKELEKGKSIHNLDNNKLNIEFESFTHVLTNPLKIGKLKIFFDDLILEEILTGMIIKYNNGKITIFDKERSNYEKDDEFLTYHYVINKESPFFNYPNFNDIPDEFYITKYGFFKEEQLKYLIIIKPIFFVKGIIKFLFINIPSKILRKLRKIRLKK